MLTAKEGEYDEAEAFELGADDYLRKPFSQMILLARIRSLARRATNPHPETLTLGNLTIEPQRLGCRRSDTTIELTPREFAVLETLLRQAPNIVTKSELIHKVWGLDFDGDANIAEVYVGYVRKKIDKPFDTKSIRTVRGVGYQMIAES